MVNHTIPALSVHIDPMFFTCECLLFVFTRLFRNLGIYEVFVNYNVYFVGLSARKGVGSQNIWIEVRLQISDLYNRHLKTYGMFFFIFFFSVH